MLTQQNKNAPHLWEKILILWLNSKDIQDAKMKIKYGWTLVEMIYERHTLLYLSAKFLLPTRGEPKLYIETLMRPCLKLGQFKLSLFDYWKLNTKSRMSYDIPGQLTRRNLKCKEGSQCTAKTMSSNIYLPGMICVMLCIAGKRITAV